VVGRWVGSGFGLDGYGVRVSGRLCLGLESVGMLIEVEDGGGVGNFEEVVRKKESVEDG
jgi:hypothetical protein